MGMVAENDQPFKGLISHLKSTFHSGVKVSDFISHSQNARQSDDGFADDLLTFTWRIIVCKPSFHTWDNEQL